MKLNNNINFIKYDKGCKILDFNEKLNQIKIKDIIIIYLISTFIVSIIIFGIIKINHKQSGNFIVNIVSMILQLLILLMLIFKIRPSKDNLILLYEDFKNKLNIKEIANVTIVKICIALGGSKLIISLMYYLDPSMINNFLYESGNMINSVKSYLVNVLLLLIISPITEEIIFRSVILNRIIIRFNLCTGIIVSSIDFASFYAGSGIAGALALGVINSILYIKYKNILINILVNVLNNLIILISVLPLVNKNVEDLIVTRNEIIINIFVGSFLCAAGVFMLIKFINKNIIMLSKYDKYIKASRDCKKI